MYHAIHELDTVPETPTCPLTVLSENVSDVNSSLLRNKSSCNCVDCEEVLYHMIRVTTRKQNNIRGVFELLRHGSNTGETSTPLVQCLDYSPTRSCV